MTKEKGENGIAQMLSESGYSDKAIHYFQTRENIGIIEDADQVSDLTGPCGDMMKISLHIEKDRIGDAKIQVVGCPGAVASGCALINLAKGKTLEEAGQIDVDRLYKELERMPDQKLHCARPALKTLQMALEEYREKCGQPGWGLKEG